MPNLLSCFTRPAGVFGSLLQKEPYLSFRKLGTLDPPVPGRVRISGLIYRRGPTGILFFVQFTINFGLKKKCFNDFIYKWV